MISDPLITAAARAFHTTERDIRDKSKFEMHVEARRAVCYVMRARWNARYTSIGKAVGYADHTTAMYNALQASARAEVDPDYREVLIELARVDLPGGKALETFYPSRTRHLWIPDEIRSMRKIVQPPVDIPGELWQDGGTVSETVSN